ncbi:MAG: HI0074 family nucleotidyltransferase substrate-binding subunit [Candidatus Paceibacteria bacterium]
MTKLETKKKQLNKALERLEDVLEQEKNEYIRDAAIQRFEFCFDLFWKFIKAYLEKKHGVECRSPKSCFREAYQQGILDYEDFWIEVCNKRNKTTHIYSEKNAEKVYSDLPKIKNKFKRVFLHLKDS